MLLNNVAEMNRVVAGFAGAFIDAVRQSGGDSRQVGGTIFDHPDFERLETHARDGSAGISDAPTDETALPPQE